MSDLDFDSLVVTAAEMRAIDRLTIEEAGIAGVVLMESAGRAVADAVRDLLDEDAMVCVVCGTGNNGGDGFVVARYLHGWGVPVAALLVGAREAVSGDALTQLDTADVVGVPVIEVLERFEAPAEDALESATVLVDALFGTGLARPVEGLALEAIERINDSGAVVVSVDVPSGISSDSGQILGAAVRADITVTFALRKRGLVTFPGAAHAGEIVVADIGIPPDVVEFVAPMAAMAAFERPYLPPREPDSHKGDFGHVLVVGGCPGKAGAVLLAGMAALRSGAGLVTVVTDPRCQPALEGRFPELMVEPGWDRVPAACEGKAAIVLGPGLAPDEAGEGVVRAVLASARCPVVVDAGALAGVARIGLPEGDGPRVLTPHPGEAAQLLGSTSAAIQLDRFAALGTLVERTGAIVVLKGARTLTGGPDETVTVNGSGNPGMATAGSGDVLSGIIGAFLARGLEPIVAAQLGVYVHGAAGDQAAAVQGQEGLVAGDIVDALPQVLAGPREDD